MNYRSVSDLSLLTNRNVSKVPQDVELIVGIPRSGMLVASIISLKLNLPLTDLYSFLRNDELKRGSTRIYKNNQLIRGWDAKKILLVDDSIASGNSMREAVNLVREAYPGAVVTMVAFAQKDNVDQVDMFLETVEQPRVFEWNIMHHRLLAHACLDIDGVLCVDPTKSQKDDGPNYRSFLETTNPLFIPSVKVGHLVTSRLEKYRAETEEWLGRHGVKYGQLHMLDTPAPDAASQITTHADFKAQVYKNDPHSILFIESRDNQALQIMRAANKPVFCMETNEMYVPDRNLLALKAHAMRKGLTFKAKLLRKFKHLMGRFALANG